MFGSDVLAVYVVEGAVIGLGHDRQDPVPPGALLDLGGDEGVAHHAHAVGVGDRHGRLQSTGLPDPLEARHLAVAVEPVRASEDGVFSGEALARADDGHAGAHRTFADDERALAPDNRRVPDAHARNVGDRVVRTGRQMPDRYPRLTRTLLPHTAPLYLRASSATYLRSSSPNQGGSPARAFSRILSGLVVAGIAELTLRSERTNLRSACAQVSTPNSRSGSRSL